MKKRLLLVLLALGLAGCKTLTQLAGELEAAKTNAVPSIPSIPSTQSTPTPAALTCTNWIYCPRFVDHGFDSENDDRLNAINAALAEMNAGHGTFGVEFDALPWQKHEVIVLTMRYASEIDGHLVDNNDNWWVRASGMGMRQWCTRIKGNWTEQMANDWNFDCKHPDNKGRLTYRIIGQSANVQKILTDFAAAHGIAVIME